VIRVRLNGGAIPAGLEPDPLFADSFEAGTISRWEFGYWYEAQLAGLPTDIFRAYYRQHRGGAITLPDTEAGRVLAAFLTRHYSAGFTWEDDDGKKAEDQMGPSRPEAPQEA
jgi:hypothetical protein